MLAVGGRRRAPRKIWQHKEIVVAPVPIPSDVVVVGGGLAGIVVALEALRAGRRVTLVDRDTPERLGGLALWAFGGMALVGTPLQARMKIPDTPELALRDWQRFGELDPDDTYPQQWARHYVEHSRAEVYDWLLREGVKFMPAVNWVERGLQGDGNSLPRYHIVWGTSRELTRRMIAALRDADKGVRLTVLYRHRVSALEYQGGKLAGAVAVDETTGANVHLQADVVVLAMGGINGSHQEARANWPGDRPIPATMLNGAHPYADGAMHHWVADNLGGTDHPCRRDVELRRGLSPPLPALRRPWPVYHPLQIGAVAQSPGRAHRPRAAGHRL
jgi:predicted oxidoreductase